jgi:hypothetical protein
MILIHSNARAEKAWADGESADLDATHGALFAELAASGELVDGNELATDDVAVIGRHNGEPITTRGPFTEGTEWIGGYYIVDVADRERAVEIAGRLAENKYSPIEIRRVMHTPPTD